MPIIDYGAKAEKLEKALFESKKISQKNKDLLQRFLTSYDVTEARRTIFLERIRFLLEADEDVEELFKDRDKINRIFRKFRTRYSVSTCSTFAAVSIRFGRWLNDGELPIGFQDVVRQRKLKKRRDLDPADMVTWEEGLQLAEKSNSIQMKAIILTQLDAGFRPSEFVDLNYGDVSVMERVVVFHVKNGKTGSRDVVAYRAAPHFLRWYHAHPSKKPKDPLWVQEFAHPSRANEYLDKRYKYPALRKRIASLAFLCGLKKPLDFYNLRHSSCALDKIDNLPLELAADRHGHSVKYFTSVYGRLSTKDVIKRFKLHYGEKVKKEAVRGNQTCESCGFPNAPDAKVCERCSSPLSAIEKFAASSGVFKETLTKRIDAEKRSEEIEAQAASLVNMQSRLETMNEALRIQQAEIESRMAVLQNQAKEIAVKEIRAGLASRS